MSIESNIAIAKTLLEKMSSGEDPDEIAAPFAEDLDYDIQGDVGVMPWIGHKTGRQAMADFMRDLQAMTEPLAFEVEDVLASEERAVIVGSLRTRIKETSKVTAGQFALVLTIKDEMVTRFQMLEDSFDLSNAARFAPTRSPATNDR